MSEPLEGLGNSLDIGYEYEGLDTDLKDFINDYDNTEIRSNLPVTAEENKVDGDVKLGERDYMIVELKEQVARLKNVLKILEQDIKIGAKPRVHEVYATLSKSLSDTLKELKDLQCAEAGLNIQQQRIDLSERRLEAKNNPLGGINVGPGGNVNLLLTQTDLLKMMKEAKENSSVNDVEAVFDLGGEATKIIEQKKKEGNSLK